MIVGFSSFNHQVGSQLSTRKTLVLDMRVACALQTIPSPNLLAFNSWQFLDFIDIMVVPKLAGDLGEFLGYQ